MSTVRSVVFLDSNPLGLLCFSRNNSKVDECLTWLRSLIANGKIIVVPEITDYEVRRGLVLTNLEKPGSRAEHIAKLDQLGATHQYLPLDTPTMRKASELWAEVRYRRITTAPPDRIDGDAVLAAQAIVSDNGRGEVIIATRNVSHLSALLYGSSVQAEEWQKIS